MNLPNIEYQSHILSKGRGGGFVSFPRKSQGHSVCDLEIIPIEKIRQDNPLVRKVRESFYIDKFDSAKNGLNVRKWRSYANCNFFKFQKTLNNLSMFFCSFEWRSFLFRCRLFMILPVDLTDKPVFCQNLFLFIYNLTIEETC